MQISSLKNHIQGGWREVHHQELRGRTLQRTRRVLNPRGPLDFFKSDSIEGQSLALAVATSDEQP